MDSLRQDSLKNAAIQELNQQKQELNQLQETK